MVTVRVEGEGRVWYMQTEHEIHARFVAELIANNLQQGVVSVECGMTTLWGVEVRDGKRVDREMPDRG